jgi:hypothetical protein
MDISKQAIGPTFKCQAVRENGIDMLSWNIGKKQPFYAAWNPKSADLICTSELTEMLKRGGQLLLAAVSPI